MKTRRLVLSVSLSLLTLASFPALCGATFIPGPPGKIVFTSARPSDGVPAPNAGDLGARIYVADYPGGTPVQVTTLPSGATVRHRQPNWSPDHTRIVYAGGSGANYALWILDLRDGSQTEFVAAAPGTDRPSWSPDGTEIAYSSEGDLYLKHVDAVGTAQGQKLTNTPDIDERPVWSPDGQTLYFNRGPGTNRDLYKLSPVSPSGKVDPVLDSATNDWQPALSPDGTRLCFLRGEQNSNSDLYTVPVDGSSNAAELAKTEMVGELNCVWSPDGTKILYTRGAFESGDLYTRSPNGQNMLELGSFNFESHFDGNADWATNFPPECADRSADTGVNQFTTISLSCTDPDFGLGKAPPTPTPLDTTDMEILSQPAHGTLGGVSDDAKVIYTPVKDFRGTDAFTYTGSDSASDAEPATVTISVGQGDGGGAGEARAALRISKIKVSPKRWRRGKRLAAISRAPVGTTISFRLSGKARTTLSFQRRTRKRGKARFVGAGKLGLAGRAGRNNVRFEGLIKKSKRLAPGSYRVVVSARDSAGSRAKRSGPTFTIVSG